jgi:hypothetical protein
MDAKGMKNQLKRAFLALFAAFAVKTFKGSSAEGCMLVLNFFVSPHGDHP